MSSKREKFYTLCKKLWTAGAAAAFATAFLISGSQFTPVAHAQGGGIWNGDNYTYESTDTITLSNENIIGTGVFIESSGNADVSKNNVSVTNNSVIKAVYGNLYATNSLSISNSEVSLSASGVFAGGGVTIGNQSKVEQGFGGRITANRDSVIINNSLLKQGNAGTIESLWEDLKFENNANITQGDTSTILANKKVDINGSTAKQGNGSTVESKASTISVTNGGKLVQGNASNVKTGAGQSIIVTNGEISQGLNGHILAGGTLNITGGSMINQLANGTIQSGNGYGVNINNTIVEQGNGSHLISGGALTLGNGTSVTSITQGDDSSIKGGNASDVEIIGATIEQGDNTNLISDKNLTITGTITKESTITQGDQSNVNAKGTLSATYTTIDQGDDSKITGNTVTLSDTKVRQEENGLIGGLTTTSVSIVGGTILQENGGRIQGNNSVTLSNTNVSQKENGSITSNGTMTIGTGTVINQEYGLSVITSIDNMTVNGATINQSTNMSGTGGVNSRLGSGGLLRIEGASKITQGGDGRINGDAGVFIEAGSIINQGDASAITTLAGNNITIGGTVTQGEGSLIRTTNGGKLSLQDGARIYQGDNSQIVNADYATVTLNGTIIQQGSNSILRTGGGLVIANSGTKVENIRLGNNSLLAAETVTLNNAQVSVGTGSEIRLGYVDARTEKEKEDAQVQLTLTNGSLLWNRGGGLLAIGSEVGGRTEVSAFNKISIGANSEIFSSGLLTLNNDWIEITATGKLASTGIISLTNGSKVYGNGSIMTSQGLIVTGGSILSPGNNYGKDIGTLYVSGPLMITPSGIVEIQVTANGNSDLIVVSHNVIRNDAGQVTYSLEDGDVLIGGLLRMSGNIDEEKVYTILQAEGTIAGEFVFDEAFYVANQWIVEENGWQYLKVGGVQEKGTYFVDRAKTFNQKAAGRMLDKIGTSGPWWDVKTYLNGLDTPAFLSALDMISGNVKANSMTLYRENPWRNATDQFGWDPCGQILLGDQNRFCPNVCQTRAVWATPYYTDADYRSDNNAGAYTVNSVGFQMGINQKLDQKTAVGIFFGYGRPEMKQNWDNVDMDDFTIGLTAAGMLTSKLEWKAVVAGGFQNYSMRRFVTIPTPGFLTSDFDGNTLFASIELARPVYLNTGVLVRPLLAFESENVWQQSFRERGASPLALDFASIHNDRTFVRTGFDTEIGARNLTLLGRAFYSHQLGGSPFSQNDIRFVAAGNNTAFERVRGIDLERNFATLGAGGKFYLNPRKTQTIAGNYDAIISAKSTSHAIYASFTQMF